MLRVLMLLLPLLASTTSCRPSCPSTIPVEPARPPAQITVTPDPTPCILPTLGKRPVFGGVPDGDKYIVTKSGLDELANYLHAVNAWIEDARACLEPKRATNPLSITNIGNADVVNSAMCAEHPDWCWGAFPL